MASNSADCTFAGARFLDQAILAEHRFSYSKLEVEHGFARR
jgi:hypothetical protein